MTTQDTIETKYPYTTISEEGGQLTVAGKFWNNCNKHIAIVAVITKGIDWAAYIGTDAPNSLRAHDTYIYAARYGEKLAPWDAKHFFPDINLPYRE